MNPSIADIKAATVEYYQSRGITKADLESSIRGRAYRLCHPRQVAMYLARALTTHSLPKIGAAFGGRHHATVIHAIRSLEKREKCLKDAEAIRRALEARTSPRSAFGQELAACQAIAEFAHSLPVVRHWLILGSSTTLSDVQG